MKMFVYTEPKKYCPICDKNVKFIIADTETRCCIFKGEKENTVTLDHFSLERISAILHQFKIQFTSANITFEHTLVKLHKASK